MSTIVIIAALDRELAPLVHNWQRCQFSHDGGRFRVYEHENQAAVAGGIGRRAAMIAARAMIVRYHPKLLISVGVAGALVRELKAGTLIIPKRIVDSSTGAQYSLDCGSGVLVTATEIVEGAARAELAARFRASAVDMESAAVAQAAQQEGIEFLCVKAISDEVGFALPPLNQFVDQGAFNTFRFVTWAALRPLRWPGIVTLARNTRLAAEALCHYLEEDVLNRRAVGVGKGAG